MKRSTIFVAYNRDSTGLGAELKQAFESLEECENYCKRGHANIWQSVELKKEKETEAK